MFPCAVAFLQKCFTGKAQAQWCSISAAFFECEMQIMDVYQEQRP